MAPMRHAFPPSHHHSQLDRVLTPQQAADNIAQFLAKSATHPYLHPDSLLTSAGVKFAPQSGPNGGLALHHLRRIERGMRGENLIPETKEELARFEDAKIDERSDAASGVSKRKRERGRKVEEWSDTPFQVASSGDLPVSSGEWQDKEEWEAGQRPVEGDVGDTEGAPEARKFRDVEGIKEHDSDGNLGGKSTKKTKVDVKEDDDQPLVKGNGQEKTEAEKAARKAAKKARRNAEKQKLARERG